MFSEATIKTIYLAPSAREMSLQGQAPYTLIINPQNCLTQSGANPYSQYKPYKIVYNFNDGSELKYVSLSVKPNQTDYELPWPNEPNDPRNHPITHTFFLNTSATTTFNVGVSVFWFAPPDYPFNHLEYNVKLKLFAPTLRPGDLFSNIHLHSIKMFGSDDSILYNFESESPSILLPTLVKWKKPSTTKSLVELPSTIASFIDPESISPTRPYKKIDPFLHNITENLESNA